MNSHKNEFVVEECDPGPMMGKENLQWIYPDPKLYKMYIYKNMGFLLMGDQKKPDNHPDKDIVWMDQNPKKALDFSVPVSHIGNKRKLDGCYYMPVEGMWFSLPLDNGK